MLPGSKRKSRKSGFVRQDTKFLNMRMQIEKKLEENQIEYKS
jgi:hypothetical protein